MDDIQITVSSIKTHTPTAKNRRPYIGKVQRIISEYTPMLENMAEITVHDQCRASWQGHECRNPHLQFQYRKIEGTSTKYLRYNWRTGDVETVSVPLRHDVIITRRFTPAISREVTA